MSKESFIFYDCSWFGCFANDIRLFFNCHVRTASATGILRNWRVLQVSASQLGLRFRIIRSQCRVEHYSHREMAQLHLIYGEAKGNGRATQRLCRQRFFYPMECRICSLNVYTCVVVLLCGCISLNLYGVLNNLPGILLLFHSTGKVHLKRVSHCIYDHVYDWVALKICLRTTDFHHKFLSI